MLFQGSLGLATLRFGHEEHRSRCPPNRPSPVTDKSQESHGSHIVPADAIVCVGEVNRRDGVGSTKSKEGSVLHEKGCQCYLDVAKIETVEGKVLNTK